LLELKKATAIKFLNPAKKFDVLSAGKRPICRPNRMVVLNRAVIKGICSILIFNQEIN